MLINIVLELVVMQQDRALLVKDVPTKPNVRVEKENSRLV